MRPGDIEADVGVSSDMQTLLIRPRNMEDSRRLRGALRAAAPEVTLRRSAAGFIVNPDDGSKIMGANFPVRLRWSPDARLFVENRNRAKGSHSGLKAHVSRIFRGGRKVAEEYLRDRTGLDALDDHQVVNVAAMTLPGGFGLCLFDEQGAGKTVSLIYAFDLLVHRDEVDFALIVAPKSMVPEWPHDIQRFKGDLYEVCVASGTTTNKRKAFRSDADVVVTNFETAVSMEADLRALLARRKGRSILVVDESYLIKNSDAQRSKALRRLREHCGRAFVLCGTPAPNRPSDVIEQFNLVDFGYTFAGVSIPGDSTLVVPAVQAAIEERGLSLRHMKADVLPDLPAKRFQRVLTPLEPIQGRLYSEALGNLRREVAVVNETDFGRRKLSFLAKRSALLQLCSNPKAVVPGYAETPNKLLALDEILEDLVGNRKEKAIVWSFYTVSLEAIVARYKRFNPVRYDGTVNDTAARRDAVRRFQEDDETMLFVANPAAAGAGLTLHRARVAVFESMSNQAAHYLQALDRIHRRGQTRPVDYLVLLGESSIELGEYDRLLLKQDRAKALLGDPADRPLTRDVFLRELDAASALFEASGSVG